MKKTLKFLSWMFILLLTVSVSSCKDDDEPANGLVGSWNDEAEDAEDEDGDGFVTVTTLTFNNDNSGKMVSVVRSLSSGSVSTTEKSFTYSFDNGELMLVYPKGSFEKYKVILSNNTMTWTKMRNNGELTDVVYFYTRV